MPLIKMALKLARKLVCMDPREQEEAVPEAIPPELEQDEAHAVEPGRPYQDYVESEARRYWQSLGGIGSLTKPDQEELRAAAMPILCRALRNRPGNRRHQAVAALVQHALERGWIKSPFSEACESQNYIDAMIELARDARWSVPLEEARRVLKHTIEWKLSVSSIPPEDESEMRQGVRGTNSIDRLCEMYDLLTRKEWQIGRIEDSRERQAVLADMGEVMSRDVRSLRFVLGKKQNLEADAVEDEIRQYLRAICHPFISQAVFNLEFGYSDAVADYSGLLHASDGIYGVGNCSIFYYENKDRRLIRIVGIGYLDRNTFRLEYAAGELENCRGKLHFPHELEYGIWPS